MPKLSNARRHRRQHNLAGYCVNQTLRKVSEEDIQEQTTTTASDSQDCDFSDCRPVLKRREPSTCLSDLCFLSPVPKVPSDDQKHEGSCTEENDSNRTISPIWGHFVDVVLDDEDRECPSPVVFGNDLTPWPVSSRAHSPYGESARKRLRLRSPQRVKDEEMDGFILQDPSTLQEALSRMSV